jgi:hypothetical protein
MTDFFLTITAFMLRMILGVGGWGGALFFAVIAARYGFTGVKLGGDWYLFSDCLGFGFMVFYALPTNGRGL